MTNFEIREFRDVGSYQQLPADLVSGLETCIASAFGGGITQEDARGHMGGQQVLVASENVAGVNVVKGFSSTSVVSPAEVFKNRDLSTRRAAYFAGAAICSTVQGRGLYHDLNKLRIGFALENGVDEIFTRTQNPRVQEGITTSVNRLVDEGLIRGYVLSRVMLSGVYGKMLTATRPIGRTVHYADLNYDRGDAAVITWQFQK